MRGASGRGVATGRRCVGDVDAAFKAVLPM